MPIPTPPTYFGRWEISKEHTILIPENAPWRELFHSLDTAVEISTNEPVSILDEAEAIVACCLRYGSFYFALCQGAKWSSKTESEMSLISDSEMKRINLEFSSGLSQWLQDSYYNRAKIIHRIHMVQKYLDRNWGTKVIRKGKIVDYYSTVFIETNPAREVDSDEIDMPDFRRESNYIVNTRYRNGPI